MDKFRELEIICESENTLEALLKKRGFSRRLIVAMKRTEGGITRNGELCRTIDKVFAGDRVLLKIPMGSGNDIVPNRELTVPMVYEDSDLIIYNKPAGMAVHRSHGHYDDTLENVFAAQLDMPFRAVNRLDKDTSGLCIAAKNKLGADMTVTEKVYYAVCEGIVSEPQRIDQPIGRADGSVIMREVRPDGKNAVTVIKPLKCMKNYTLLEIRLETGRTHQIRVHLSHISHPLAGDDMYGGSRKLIARQALHCGKMSFIHPVSGENVTVSADMPEDMTEIIRKEML